MRMLNTTQDYGCHWKEGGEGDQGGAQGDFNCI